MPSPVSPFFVLAIYAMKRMLFASSCAARASRISKVSAFSHIPLCGMLSPEPLLDTLATAALKRMLSGGNCSARASGESSVQPFAHRVSCVTLTCAVIRHAGDHCIESDAARPQLRRQGLQDRRTPHAARLVRAAVAVPVEVEGPQQPSVAAAEFGPAKDITFYGSAVLCANGVV